MGKSHTTLAYLNENNINHIYLNSYSTPLYFYKLLYENRNRDVIVFDDLEGLGDPKIIAMLKGACWSVNKSNNIVSYYSTSEKLQEHNLPTTFKLKANIILIFNNIPNHFKAVTNRGIKIDFDFDYFEKLEIFNKLFKNTGKSVKVSKVSNDILSYIGLNCDPSTENLSLRTLTILSNLQTSGFVWQDFAKEILKPEENKNLLISKVSKCHEIQKSYQEWNKETGLSRSTFFRYYKELGGKKLKNYLENIKEEQQKAKEHTKIIKSIEGVKKCLEKQQTKKMKKS